MKKRLLTTLFGLLVILGSWAENMLVATLTSTATTNISLRLKAVENGVPVQIDWGDGVLAEAVVNTASTSLSGKPLGEIKIYGDVTKLTYLLPYNAKITKVDLSGWNGLQVLDFSSNSSLLAELVLPTETNNLLSLNVKSASLTRLDVSSYLKLVTLVCGATKLTELVLPSANCDLKELTCTSSGLTTINTHACNNLEKLDISYNSKMKTFVLPDNKEKFKSLTCTSVAIEGTTLDVSAYTNLIYLYCDYCQLTSLSIPANPVSGIEIDCSSNYIPMYGLPEVNSTKVYYTPQFCKYELGEKYTTNDLVDLTTAYVRKKGTGYNYNAEGILPTFTWYIESPKKQLIENEDYTVTDGCKFRFSTSVGKSIYCEIANSGYSNLSGQEAFKSTSFTLEEGVSNPVAVLTTTATSSVSLKLKATENDVPVKIDWGNGSLVDAIVNTASTSISGTPSGEKVIKIYGDVSKLVYLSPYNAKITKADLSSWSGLQSLDFSSNSSLLAELTLPAETGSLLSLNVNSALIARLDVGVYNKLATLVCGGSKLMELVLPSGDCGLKELTCKSSGLTTLDAHACNNLEKLDISNNSKMKTFVLPDNKEKFKSLTCTSVAIEGKTLDVSAYVNLNYLYCDYCQLTSLTVPSNPVSGIEIDCSSNYIPMYGLPEVNSSKVYYTPQFCKYTLNDSYTTNDVVDLSTAYIRKKGAGSGYNADGILPTFIWYTESPKKLLVENEDYTVTDGCKFKFSAPIDKSVYCEIAHTGYSYLSGQEAFKSTSFTLKEGLPSLVLLESSSTKNINLKLKATEDNLPVQIDWGNGILTNATVNTALTTLSGTPAGMIKIYGDNSKLIYADFSTCSLKSADFSQWDGLQTLIFKSNTAITNLDLGKCSVLKSLECASNSKLADLKLPEAGDKLESLVLNNNSLAALDLSRFINLKSLNCKSNPIKQLILPTTDNQLASIEATYVQLTSLDLSKCSKLKTLNLGKSDDVKLEPLVLPENADVLTDLTLMQCGLTDLDVSKYVNLKNLDCTYNYLTSVRIPENPNNALSVDCSSNYMFMPTFPEGEKVSLYYMEQRETVSKFTLKNSYSTADEVDLSELHVLKKGISGSYFPEGVYPTYKWYVEGKSDALVADVDYIALGGGKFKFGKVPEGKVYCVVVSSAYPAYQDYNAPYKTTSISIEKAPDPIVALTTSNERLIGFSLYATEDNMPVQIDWGNGSLVEKTVNMTKTSIQGTPSGTKVIKIYGDASKLNRITLAYGDYLTDVDLSKSNALSTLEIIECYRIVNTIFPENNSTLETLNISNSSIKNLDVHNWAALKNLTYVPYGAGTIVLPDNAVSLEKMNLGKLSLETIDLSKYINLKEIVCNSNTKLTGLVVPGNNLASLEVTSNGLLASLDVSSCTKLNKLNCRNNVKLVSLILPTDKTVLQEFNCARTGLTLDLSGYTNLQVLDCSQIKNIVFPSNAGIMTSLTCQETGLTGTLDVSSYVNLKKLDCSYNDLTAILVPENLNNILDIDCSYNLLRMPNFPEGEKITMSYIFQKEKVMKYELKNSYTTDDVIDFSDYYVLKKGIAKSYNAAGVYPTFTWYLEKNNEKLQAGKDYTVTGGCKFQFTKVPDGNVYCVIDSKAYPDYTELNIPYKSTVCSISKGTGVDRIDADIAKVYSYDNTIVIIPAEACNYTISSLTGQVIAIGEVQDEAEISVNVSGLYIVNVKAVNRESTYKVVIR